MAADETPGTTFDEWCHEQDEDLDFENLIKKFTPQIGLFNYLLKSEEEETRRRDELLFHAGQLKNEEGLYTNEHFQAYAQMRDKLIKDSKQKILEETIQKRIDLLSAELGQLSKRSLEDVGKLEARIQDVYTEIGGESQHELSIKERQTFLEETIQREFRTSKTCMMAQTTGKIYLNILLIGKTGHGKSATGNSILGRKHFKTSSNSNSETKVVTDAWAEHGPYEIKVVDGPGLEDTDLNATKNKEQACTNMAKALMMCNGGVHAFVLVIRFGTRHTQEEKTAISDLQQILGENYLKNHGIIVITGGDCFAGQMAADETPGKTFDQWCHEQQEGGFRNLIEECSPRVVLFNNLSTSEEERTRQRDELLFHAGKLKKEKGLYTNEHFQAYTHMRDKLIKDSKQKILEETIQKRIDLLSAQLGQLSKRSLEDVGKLEARIQDVYTEIGGKSQQELSMKQLIDSLERLDTTTEELRRAIREKNPGAIESHLVTMSQHREVLNKTRQIPWGKVCAVIGAGLAAAAFVAGGVVAVVASGGVLAPVVVTLGGLLLRFATIFVSNK